MEEFLGISLIISAYKSENESLKEFLIRLHKYPKTWDLENFEIMSREKYTAIHSNLDIGTTVQVPNENAPNYHVIDLNRKFDPIYTHFNTCNLELKKPDPSLPLAIDESLRSSHSRSCQLRTFMPSKPAKYGQKDFFLAGPDLFIYRAIPQFPKQFALTNGTIRDLMSKIVPESFNNQGLVIICDNYF